MAFEALNFFSGKSYRQSGKHDGVFSKQQHQLIGSQLCSTCCSCGKYLYPTKEMEHDMDN